MQKTSEGMAIHATSASGMDLLPVPGLPSSPTKKCSKCHEIKLHTEFHKGKRGRFGLNAWCKECAYMAQVAWREHNKEKYQKYHKEHRLKTRKKVLQAYGDECKCCGENTPKFLAFDHINNDGKEHRKTVGSGNAMYLFLIKKGYPDDIQILCHNCNLAKTYYGRCPHEHE